MKNQQRIKDFLYDRRDNLVLSVIILSMLSVYGRAPFLTYTPSETTISYSYKTSNNSYHNDYSRFDSRLGLNFNSRETEKVLPYNNMRLTDVNMNETYFFNRMSNHSKMFPDLLKRNISNNKGNGLNGNSLIAAVDDSDDEKNDLLVLEGMKEPTIEEPANNSSESNITDIPENENISMEETINNDLENKSENIVIEENPEPEYVEDNFHNEINENNSFSEGNYPSDSQTYVRYTDWNGKSVEVPVHLESFDLETYESLDFETKENIRMIALTMDEESNGTIEDDYGVGSVLVNRIGHWGFPSTIREILSAPYQYPWVNSESIQKEPTEDSLIKAYDIWINGTNIFSNNVVFQAQFTQGDGVYALIGVHYYCYKD